MFSDEVFIFRDHNQEGSMPKANKSNNGGKGKVYNVPSAQKKRDVGVPKLQSSKLAGKQAVNVAKARPAPPTSILPVAPELAFPLDPSSSTWHQPIDSSLTRDSSSKAFMRELRKVIERSDVIIQVLDARDPDGTRSRWVEEEVRKRDIDGKKLLAVVNKIDLVPRANLEAWLKHLRHSFPCMPFKSSTQNQRQNLSQNSVPIVQAPSVPGQKVTLPELPSTSSSLGAPALLQLLKQYALNTHASLTVGVVGYPNVGKSSLINSLKRSRACAVAAMPGKTRVVQEVVLDKGVKILDCPGVVLEDLSREESEKKRAEIMLRNCIKAELVDDPITSVEVILSKVQPEILQNLYNIPPYQDVREFLIRIALTKGRLGKGGVPDLDAAAMNVLRDWNVGKIPYFTIPPANHPASVPTAAPLANGDTDMDDLDGVPGGAKILNQLSEAFTLDGLLDVTGDDAAWDKEENVQDQPGEMEEDFDIPPQPSGPTSVPAPTAPAFARIDSESEDEDEVARPAYRPPSLATAPTPIQSTFVKPVLPTSGAASKLFTPDELSVLPNGMLDRQKAKQAAKKAKKRRAAAERTEDELTLGFMGMDVEEPTAEIEEIQTRPSHKKARKDKVRPMPAAKAMPVPTVEQKKEADFVNFLASVGAEDSDEEL